MKNSFSFWPALLGILSGGTAVLLLLLFGPQGASSTVLLRSPSAEIATTHQQLLQQPWLQEKLNPLASAHSWLLQPPLTIRHASGSQLIELISRADKAEQAKEQAERVLQKYKAWVRQFNKRQAVPANTAAIQQADTEMAVLTAKRDALRKKLWDVSLTDAQTLLSLYEEPVSRRVIPEHLLGKQGWLVNTDRMIEVKKLLRYQEQIIELQDTLTADKEFTPLSLSVLQVVRSANIRHQQENVIRPIYFSLAFLLVAALAYGISLHWVKEEASTQAVSDKVAVPPSTDEQLEALAPSPASAEALQKAKQLNTIPSAQALTEQHEAKQIQDTERPVLWQVKEAGLKRFRLAFPAPRIITLAGFDHQSGEFEPAVLAFVKALLMSDKAKQQLLILDTRHAARSEWAALVPESLEANEHALPSDLPIEPNPFVMNDEVHWLSIQDSDDELSASALASPSFQLMLRSIKKQYSSVLMLSDLTTRSERTLKALLPQSQGMVLLAKQRPDKALFDLSKETLTALGAAKVESLVIETQANSSPSSLEQVS